MWRECASKSKRINGKFAFIFIVNFHYVVRLFEGRTPKGPPSETRKICHALFYSILCSINDSIVSRFSSGRLVCLCVCVRMEFTVVNRKSSNRFYFNEFFDSNVELITNEKGARG